MPSARRENLAAALLEQRGHRVVAPSLEAPQ